VVARRRGQVKKVEAYIQPFKFDEVKRKLATLDVQGMTVSEVKTFGPGDGGPDALLQAVPSLKIEIVVRDFKTEQVIEAIERAARTGGGRIVVLPVAETVRIRTGDSGDEAL